MLFINNNNNLNGLIDCMVINEKKTNICLSNQCPSQVFYVSKKKSFSNQNMNQQQRISKIYQSHHNHQQFFFFFFCCSQSKSQQQFSIK